MKSIFLSLILIFSFSNILGQNIDSLLEIESQIVEPTDLLEHNIVLIKYFINNRQWSNADRYVNQALMIATSLKDKNRIAQIHNYQGISLIIRGAYDEADSIFVEGLQYNPGQEVSIELLAGRLNCNLRTGNQDKTVTYLEQMRSIIGDDTTSLEMGTYYFELSNYYSGKKDILKKLEYLQKSKELAIKHGDGLEAINSNLAGIYETLKDYEKQLELQLELRAIAQEDNHAISELFSIYGIISAQYGLKRYEALRKSCFEAINLKKNTNLSNAFGYVYFMMGLSHRDEGQLDSAAYYFNQGIEISILQDETQELGDNYAGMASLMLQKGDFKEARRYGEMAREVMLYSNSNNNTVLAKAYVQQGNYQKAYELLNENWTNNEKLKEDRTEYKMISALLREQYEQEKATEQLVFKQELKTQRQFFITTILLIGVAVLGLIIFIQRRNNRKLKGLNQTLDTTNKKLEQSNFELKTFNYIASHDIKEPIRNIGNYVGLIFRKLSNDQKESLGSYFETIKSSTKQLYTLIEDFAKYTNLSKDTVIEKQDVDLKWLVGSVKDGIHDTIQKYEGRIITQELPTIYSNSSLLYPILKNLIENGLKFNHSTVPTVTINYQQSTDYHQITISDNGIGIEEDYHEKIFEMFKRLHHRGQYSGSGVGLAIVKLCLDKLDGTIDLESKKDEGTKFTIQLPV